MDKIPTAHDDLLLNYLDGKLDGATLSTLKKELENSELMRLRLDKLRMVHRALAHATTLEAPSQVFVANVMKGVNVVPVSSGLSPRNGLLLLAGVMVATGILVVMISAGIFDQVNGLVSLDQAIPVKKYFQQSLPVIPVDGKLIIHIIIALDLVLAFLVLDRTVLRPFFQKRAGLQL